MYEGLKAFSLHTVHDDVPLCAYIEHVRMTHKHMYSAQSQNLQFLVRIPFFLNRLNVRNCVRIIEVSDNRGMNNRGRTVPHSSISSPGGGGWGWGGGNILQSLPRLGHHSREGSIASTLGSDVNGSGV